MAQYQPGDLVLITGNDEKACRHGLLIGSVATVVKHTGTGRYELSGTMFDGTTTDIMYVHPMNFVRAVAPTTPEEIEEYLHG